jgi:D-alanyl-D-alanine carboxypeptidase
MRKKFKVEISKLKVSERYLSFILLFSFFTFHFSLSTSFADDINSRAAVVMDASTGAILYAKKS